jgi:hypothetical protein
MRRGPRHNNVHSEMMHHHHYNAICQNGNINLLILSFKLNAGTIDVVESSGFCTVVFYTAKVPPRSS